MVFLLMGFGMLLVATGLGMVLAAGVWIAYGVILPVFDYRIRREVMRNRIKWEADTFIRRVLFLGGHWP